MAKRKLAALLLIVAVLCTACDLFEGKDYTVQGEPDGLHMHIVPVQSWNITDVVWWHICNTNPPCTGNWLHDHVQVSGWGAAEWHEATHYYNDLWAQLNDQWFTPSHCLSLHKDWVLDLNWEHYTCSGLPPASIIVR